MPFRPSEIVIHEAVQDAYDSWQSLPAQGRQPGQAVWNSLQTCLIRLRENGQWGEVVKQGSIPKYFREKYAVSNLYWWTWPHFIDASTPSQTARRSSSTLWIILSTTLGSLAVDDTRTDGISPSRPAPIDAGWVAQMGPRGSLAEPRIEDLSRDLRARAEFRSTSAC
jgi:hypothetical protein